MTRPPRKALAYRGDDTAAPLRGQTFIVAEHGAVEQSGRLWRAKGRLPDVTTKSNRENAEGGAIWGWPAAVALAYGAGAFMAWLIWGPA